MSKNVDKQIDLNKASSQDIERVQAVGKEQARKIMEYRTQNGNFKSWDDVRKVPGVTTEILDMLKRNGFTVAGKAA